MARLLLSEAAAAAKESHFACFPNCTGSPVCLYDGCILSPTTLPVFPLDPPPADDGSVSVGISHKHRLIQSFLIAAAALLAFAFFMLLVFYFLLRLRRRRRRQLAALHQHHPPPPLDPNADDDLLDDDGGLHHVWYIRTVGLDDSVIKSIAATIYKAGDGLIDGGDCSVCLGEFREGETIKLLPKCTHAFHLSCIDTWLRSHVNCPLCRAPVVAPPPPAAASPAEAGGSVPSPENAQIEISQLESQEVSVIAIDSAAAASSSSGQLDGDGDGEVQPIRRSVSMDSLALGMLLLRAESESDAEEKLGEEKREIEVEGAAGAHKNKGKGVAVVEYLGKQLQGAEMKRSLSARSGRLFLSRYGRGRGRSASVLPL